MSNKLGSGSPPGLQHKQYAGLQSSEELLHLRHLVVQRMPLAWWQRLI